MIRKTSCGLLFKTTCQEFAALLLRFSTPTSGCWWWCEITQQKTEISLWWLHVQSQDQGNLVKWKLIVSDQCLDAAEEMLQPSKLVWASTNFVTVRDVRNRDQTAREDNIWCSGLSSTGEDWSWEHSSLVISSGDQNIRIHLVPLLQSEMQPCHYAQSSRISTDLVMSQR